jgi:hypothetical protein
MKILDPRFQYTPAVATDVSRTWKRFGFNAQANEARHAQWRGRLPAAQLPANARSAVLVLCTSVLAACAELPPTSPVLEARQGSDYTVRSPVFIHAVDAGGEAPAKEPAATALDFSKQTDYWIKDCLAAKRLGLRVAESLGSGPRGRSDACRSTGNSGE